MNSLSNEEEVCEVQFFWQLKKNLFDYLDEVDDFEKVYFVIYKHTGMDVTL